jgi:hypothetical protein
LLSGICAKTTCAAMAADTATLKEHIVYTERAN